MKDDNKQIAKAARLRRLHEKLNLIKERHEEELRPVREEIARLQG